MGNEGFHEELRALRPETQDQHRAITSIMEELEAIDWYNQRVDAVGDQALGGILAHNRDEEKEHAAMLIEWLRRHDGTFASMLTKYLFTEEDILEVEEEPEGAAGGSGSPSTGNGGLGNGGLGIGSLRNKEPNL